MKRRSLVVAAVATVGLALATPGASADVGQPRTEGSRYDRNPTLVQDGPLTYLLFARSQVPCNRLAGCNPDNLDYDMYVKVSPDGGKTFGPAQFVAPNPDGPGPFWGRTLAATVDAQGVIHVFWASGGNLGPLYQVIETGPGTFSPPQPVLGAPPLVFNVEAVTLGSDIYLYTEELGTPYGIYARRFDGATVTSGPTLVAADKNLPKAIVDNRTGGCKMTMVDASTYPDVDVYTDASPDCLNWPAPERLIVTQPGVSNWDPSLGQLPNGNYYLFFAPDGEQGAGRQRVALTKSNDFVRWSGPQIITPGYSGGVDYWDYWPEPFVRGNQLTLYYTSERGWNRVPHGTGHVWSVPGLGIT
jgi:hypothetical protein